MPGKEPYASSSRIFTVLFHFFDEHEPAHRVSPFRCPMACKQKHFHSICMVMHFDQDTRLCRDRATSTLEVHEDLNL